MFIANAYANFDDMISFPGKPKRPSLGDTLKGPHALYRLYATRDGWMFLGIKTEKSWRSFCHHAGAAHLPDQYPQPFTTEAEALTEELHRLFSTKTSMQWQSLFAQSGVGCVAADRFDLSGFFFEDCREGSLTMTQVQHEEYGQYYRHRPMISFSEGEVSPRAGVHAGAHSRSLMSELGYSADEIEILLERGILWSA